MTTVDPCPIPDSLDGFLFDLDGTLVQTPIDFAGMRRGLLELAESLAIDVDDLAGLDLLGMIEEAERLLDLRNTPHAVRECAEEILNRFEVEAARAAIELPGAIDTLHQLRRDNFRVGIVTRNGRDGVNLTLQRVPLPFDLLLCRHDIRRPKPHPDHLLEAARRLGAAPHRFAMVGDHPMDMKAGRAAGMYCIAVQSRDPSPDAFASVSIDLLLPGVADLSPWISALSS